MTRLLVLEQLWQSRAAKLVRGRDQSNSDRRALADNHLSRLVPLTKYSTHYQTDFLTLSTSFYDGCHLKHEVYSICAAIEPVIAQQKYAAVYYNWPVNSFTHQLLENTQTRGRSFPFRKSIWGREKCYSESRRYVEIPRPK